MSSKDGRKVLVTGAGGFVAEYLLPKLEAERYEVWTAGRWKTDTAERKVGFDLTNHASIEEAIRKVRPDRVIHLAAQSNVKDSWDDPMGTFQTNTMGTLSLLDAVFKHTPEAKILTIGSSEEYGMTEPMDRPIVETQLCNPQNPYALSKYAIGQSILQRIKRSSGLQHIHVRPFNHFGPGQRKGFVVSDFCYQIASIESGLQPPVIEVGNLEAMRDFTYVRDIVDAYLLLLGENVPAGVYNVCSSETMKISDILSLLVEQSRTRIRVEVNPAKLRALDVPLFIGSYEKLRQATGWTPRIDKSQALVNTLNWWREVVNHKGGRANV